MSNRFGAPYNPKKSTVTEKQYNANVAKSRRAIAAAGPRPTDKAGKAKWKQKADCNFKTAYDHGCAAALEKLGFIGAHLLKRRVGQVRQGMGSLGKSMQGAGQKMQNMAGTGQAWGSKPTALGMGRGGPGFSQGAKAGGLIPQQAQKPGLIDRGIKAWDRAKQQHTMDSLRNPNSLSRGTGDAIFGRLNPHQGNI